MKEEVGGRKEEGRRREEVVSFGEAGRSAMN